MDEKTYHNKNLREELIKKGLKLYNEVGYEGFSLRKVASLCGVSHNAPYRHFKDKEELILDLKELAESIDSILGKSFRLQLYEEV